VYGEGAAFQLEARTWWRLLRVSTLRTSLIDFNEQGPLLGI
jgi:hypothetical protein